MLAGRAMSGPEIVSVIGVDSVSDGAEIACCGNGFHTIEEFVLAVIAAFRVVLNVKRVLEFARFDKFMVDAAGANEVFGLVSVVT